MMPKGKLSAADPTLADAWLRLFEAALLAGKTTGEATDIADAGGKAFSKRFTPPEQQGNK